MATASSASSWRRVLPWAVATVLAIALVISLVALRQASRAPALKPVELSLSIADQELDLTNGPAIVISPDGARVAYTVRDSKSGRNHLYVRELESSAPVLLEGAGNASAPFFSPDSQWIGYFGDGKLRKVSVRGGAAIALTDVDGYRGGVWTDAGMIIFPNTFTAPLSRVPASGGTAQPFTHFDIPRSEITHRWPQILPGGRTVLFTASSDNNFFGRGFVEAAPLDSGVPQLLVENAYFGRYLPGGYLAYLSEGTVFMVPFDADKLKVTGTAIPVLQGINSDITNGGAQLSFSDNGTAVYLSSHGASHNVNVVLLDRKGNVTVLMADQQDAESPRFSPNGKLLAFGKGANSIWVHDLARGTTSAATLGITASTYPTWTPDGERLTYSHPQTTAKGSGQRMFWKRYDGTGNEEPLTADTILNAYPESWSPDGKTLLFTRLSEKDGSCCEVWSLTLDANGKPQEPRQFLSTKGAEASFSPDGRWVAYVNFDSGMSQVYVVPSSPGGGRWQVSTDGGVEPRWSKASHELFFARGSSLMAVPYSAEKNSFVPGKSQVLFNDRLEMRAPFSSYDVAPDGQHFVIFEVPGNRVASVTEPTVVLNWLDNARRVVAAGQTQSGR